MSEFVKPFDLRKIYMEYFLGSEILFVGAFVILFSFFAATLKMPERVYFSLLILGSIMFAALLGEAIYVLVLILLGFVIFKSIGRIWN